MRWLITGSGGQLGQCLVASVRARKNQSLAGALDHAEFDIAKPGALEALLRTGEVGEPDVLINAAAFTAVDRCESEEALARRVNGEAPGWLAEDCRAEGLALVHVSTDYVFSGTENRPYPENGSVAPRTAYGRSKAEGERRVVEALPEALVVRTSWVFGPGKNFVGAILRQARQRAEGQETGPLRVVSDQCGSPTYAADLAEGILDLATLAFGAKAADEEAQAENSDRARPREARGEMRGVFHLTNSGRTTWFEFARAILDEAGYGDLGVEPLASDELDLPAERPRWSVLGCERAARMGVGLRPWRDALRAYLGSPSGMAVREEPV
ncbi:MAG: dTDP-4-dehydrorhamnose reductase [Myxococcota bacterium]|nr:dTDP-4-dehydrorhamnose reductase [Myxococcota bacterium]